jgi:RNA polymerase sigma factor (TIGR02999 family)
VVDYAPREGVELDNAAFGVCGQWNMSEITQLLSEIRGGSQQGAEQLLSLVYTELKRIAAQKMAGEAPGNTLQPTALVHEAWIRLVGDGGASFENRAHFFAAAAEAMRRILVDSARRKKAIRRGAGAIREALQEGHWVQHLVPDELLAVDEALDLLAKQDPAAANLVKLRYFVGMTMDEAATTMGMSLRTAERTWTYARAWLRRQIGKQLATPGQA